MIETRHPDVYIIERPATPRIVGVGTSTGAFIGYSERGPLDKADLVTSFSQFIRKYGSYYKGSPLVYSVQGFFEQGGARAFIVRIAGTGYAEAEKDFANMSPEDLPATMSGAIALTPSVDLSIKKYLNLSIDGVSYGDIDISGAIPAATLLSEIIAAINTAVGTTVAFAGVGSVLTLTSPTTGPLSEVEIGVVTAPSVPATFTGSGFDGSAINVGNFELLLNIDGIGDVTVDLSTVAGFPGAVAVADVITEINSAIDAAPGYGGPAGPYATTATLALGEIMLTGVVLGPTGSIAIKESTPGEDARLEVFGVSEGTGTVTFLGSTVDAVTLVTGLAEGSVYTFTGSTTAPLFMKVLAINPGEWGNSLSITTQRWITTSSVIMLSGASGIKVSSIKDAKVGDVIKIGSGAGAIFRHVNEIDASLKELKFVGSPYVGPAFPVGTSVKTSTSHRMVTELVDDVLAGATTAKLLSAAAVTDGVRLVLDDKGANPVITVVVKSVNGSNITFDPIASDVDAGAVVSSMHFNLLIKEEGAVVEEFEFLSVEETDVRDYFEKRLAGDTNESKLIKVEALPVTITDLLLSPPEPVVDFFLLGGLDGVTPTPLDFLGTEEPPTGMFLLEENDEFVMFSMPGIEDIFVLRSAIAFAERLGRVMFILNTPLSDDEPLEALEFRTIELAVDSSYAALYYPWIKVRDPESTNPEALVTIPPLGHVQGIWARVAQEQGVHQAPAGVSKGNLSTVFDLTYKISDGEQDLLNPEGINAIRFFRGQGFKIWGCRTLWRNADGFHYISTRRLVNFVKESVRRSNRFAVFEPNDPALWRKIERINSEFMNNLWRLGMLFPSNDSSKAYFVQCNSETNPLSEIKRGRVNCKIGLNPPFPAEFVIFEIGLFDGGGDINENFGIST